MHEKTSLHSSYPNAVTQGTPAMPPAPDPKTRVQHIRDELEDDIVNGRLLPGEQVQIDALVERFGVSRTPVREALQQLETSGLVEVLPKRGTYVTRIGLTELVQMFEVMAELEALCARLAARRAPDRTIADIEQAMHACETVATTTQDANAYYYANEDFHRLIYDACGNPFLVQQTLALKNRLKPYRRMQLQIRDRMAQSQREHRQILAAIAQGDPEAAAQAARAHVLIQGQRFSDLMSLNAQAAASRPGRTRLAVSAGD